MSERSYTVKEIDALRRVCDNRWLFGSSVLSNGMTGRGYNQGERERAVEEIVRTHMLAGHTAEDIIAEDTEQSGAT